MIEGLITEALFYVELAVCANFVPNSCATHLQG